MEKQNSDEIYDVIVIGGGAMGLSTAVQLGKKKKKTLVLEQFDFINQKGSSAGVSRQFRIPYPEEYMVQMALNSESYWEELQSHTDAELLNKVGTLWFGDPKVQSTEGNIAEAEKALDALKVPYTKLTAAEIEQQFHFKNLPSTYSGIFQPDGASINFKATIETLLERCKINPFVELIDQAPAIEILNEQDNFQVKTPKGIYHSKKLVLVPGPYINNVINLLNFKIDATYWSMSSAYYKKKTTNIQYPTWFVFQDAIGENGNQFYGFPEVPWDNPGYIRVAPDFVISPIQDPNHRSFVPNEQELAYNSEWVENHMTELENKPEFTSTCLVALSNIPNKELIIDFAPDHVPNHKNIVIYATGWAAKFTPYLGEILSELAIDGKTDFDITPFQLGQTFFKKHTS